MFLGAQAKGGQALLTDGSELKTDRQDRQSKKKRDRQDRKSQKNSKSSKSCNKTTTDPKSKIDEIIDGVSNL
jgi:hypothetical protein